MHGEYTTAAFLAMILMLAGCAGPTPDIHRAYVGEGQAPSEVAIVRAMTAGIHESDGDELEHPETGDTVLARYALHASVLTFTHPGTGERTTLEAPLPADINAFFDGVIETYMQEKHVAGVTVSLVRDGRLWFAKGYGYADLEEKRPVDPETSLFRIGSISKAFSVTARAFAAASDMGQPWKYTLAP